MDPRALSNTVGPPHAGPRQSTCFESSVYDDSESEELTFVVACLLELRIQMFKQQIQITRS